MTKTLICTLILLFTVSLISAGPTSDLTTESELKDASPIEIHNKLWESKARSYLDESYRDLLGKADPSINTQTNYDVTFYDIDIRVNDTNEVLYGRVKFVALSTEASVSSIQIDLQSEMIVDSIIGLSGSLAFSRSVHVVTVTLDQAYNSGEEFEFDFYYHGHPTEGGFQAFSFDTRAGKKVISSLSEPYFARSWWPCKDRMDDKADSFYIAMTVDTSLYCASNGTLDSTIVGGNAQTFYYRVGYPMVTYLFSVAISNYTVWDDYWHHNPGIDSMLLRHAVYPDRYTYSLGKYDITPNVISVLSDAFGEYPFIDEKYGHANFEWGGGMEHQTVTSMTGTDFGFYWAVVVHEAGHQWYGDMITCNNWGHIWLNEGWASYSEAVYKLGTEGWASYHSYMNTMAYSGGGSIYIADTTNVWNIFSSIVYDKGAWACHMLRGVLGEAGFAAGVEAYYNSEYKHGSATTEQFRDVFEAASGQDLDYFFEDWIYGTYRPDYRYSWWEEPSDSGGFDLYLHVRQKQSTSPQVFRMPVDFYIDPVSGTGDTTTLWIGERTNTIRLNFPGQTSNIEFDPAGWILKWAASEVWSMHIISFDGDMSAGERYSSYIDTVKFRGGSGSYTVSITSGALPAGLSIDNNGIITGIPTEKGNFTFSVYLDDNGSTKFDERQFSMTVNPVSGGVPGDVNFSGDVSITDVTTLVDYLFRGGPVPQVQNLADVNADCAINISDLTGLVDYLFRGGPAPVMGCVD